MNTSPETRWCRFTRLGGLALCAWLMACTVITSAPDGGLRGPILVHTWGPLTIRPDQQWVGKRSALYTYVLIGDVGGSEGVPGNEEIENARNALAALIREVQAGQPITAIISNDTLQYANEFLLPARGYSDGQKPFELKDYDFDLASDYRNLLRIALQAMPVLAQRFDGRGPFLVAVHKPLGEIVRRVAGQPAVIDPGTDLLLIDTSGKHAKSMPIYVSEFKDAVKDANWGKPTELRPLGPAFASALLRTEAAIPFIGEAYARSSELFIKSSDGGK